MKFTVCVSKHLEICFFVCKCSFQKRFQVVYFVTLIPWGLYKVCLFSSGQSLAHTIKSVERSLVQLDPVAGQTCMYKHKH